MDAGCTSPANCTYVDYGPHAGVEEEPRRRASCAHLRATGSYTVTSVYQGAQSAFSSVTGAVIPQNAILETNVASNALARGFAAIRSVAENPLASDALTAAESLAVQPRHTFGVPGRTKTAEAPTHPPPRPAPP